MFQLQKSIQDKTPDAETGNANNPTQDPKVSNSNSDEVDHRKHRYTPRLLAAALGVWMISAGLGADIAYPSMSANDINAHPNPFHLSVHEVALFSSIFAIGAAIGSPLCGMASDRYGRRHLLILITLPVVISWLIVASSVNANMLIASRFITGFFSGCMENISPIYISEISPPGNHGLLCSFISVFRSVGYLFIFGTGQALCWNWLAIACSAFTIVAVMFLSFTRESPRWLVSIGCHEEALESLTFLRDEEHDDIQKEMIEILECVENRNLQKLTQTRGCSPVTFIRDVIVRQKTYRQLFIVGVLIVVEQFSGTYTLVVYSSNFFKVADIDVSSAVVNLCGGVAGLLGSLACSLVVDRCGRRPLLASSCGINFAFLSFLALYFSYRTFFLSNSVLRYAPVVCFLVVSFITRFGISTIPYVLNGEIFPLRHRGFFLGLVSVFSWTLTFVSTMAFPYQLLYLGDCTTTWMMAGFSFLGLVFTVLVVPETKGKSLEEIEKFFQRAAADYDTESSTSSR